MTEQRFCLEVSDYFPMSLFYLQLLRVNDGDQTSPDERERQNKRSEKRSREVGQIAAYFKMQADELGSR